MPSGFSFELRSVCGGASEQAIQRKKETERYIECETVYSSALLRVFVYVFGGGLCYISVPSSRRCLIVIAAFTILFHRASFHSVQPAFFNTLSHTNTYN